MNSTKAVFTLIRRLKIGNHYKSANTLYFSKNCSTQTTQAEELVTREKIQISKPSVVKWKRPPFVKDLFSGKFDTELLAFPEVLDNELLGEVEKYVKELNELYLQKVNSVEIDETGKIPEDLIQDLKELGFFGRMMPVKYGGLDLSYTACTRLNEVIGLDWSLYSLLTSHEFLASRVILLHGTEQQKDKYLPLLASGKKIAAFCASEFESGSEIISIKSTAKVTSDGNYLISGTKCWVTNADIADFFLVFAKTQDTMDPQQDNVSVFLIDRNTDGLTITPHEKMCLKGVKTSVVYLKEVAVPKENLIGALGLGIPIYLKAIEDFRIAMNSFTFGTLKVLLDSITDRIINTERMDQSLGDYDLVRQRLSRIACKIYAMESMAYFTAAILDTTDKPDVSLESSIMKIYNSEGTLYCIRELMELLGSTSLMKEQHLERFHRDALGLHMFDGPSDIARLFVGYTGCQVVGNKKAEEIMKARNRFFFPANSMKLSIKRVRMFSKRVKYYQDLAGHMHPSLVMWGNLLEEKLQKFELAVEDVLTEHGRKTTLQQIDPKKLADIAAHLYVQTAVLSRASRSYCIGLKHASSEVVLAGVFCLDVDQILSKIFKELFEGLIKGNESLHADLGKYIVDNKGYFPEHPLKHNF